MNLGKQKNVFACFTSRCGERRARRLISKQWYLCSIWWHHTLLPPTGPSVSEFPAYSNKASDWSLVQKDDSTDIQPYFTTTHLVKLCGKLSSFLILLGKFITYAPGAIVFQSGVIFAHKVVFNHASDYTNEMQSSLLSGITTTLMPSVTHQKLGIVSKTAQGRKYESKDFTS